ncbi:MAG: 1-acyl-sn-glycerol-3-phosphate acyltransferase [Ruminococcaceae bacterium]|nr:1-acyl-sn-glycerol-3-phosphate acyltransferase [Oscillospiraceae bacterium]
MKSKAYINIKKWLAKPVIFLFRIHAHNAENEPCEADGPYIIASNHMSNADPVFLCAATDLQQPHFMAKKELFKVPLVNKLVAALGAYPVDRKGADVAAIRKTIKMLGEGKCIGIFPQGHRYMGVEPRETEIKSGLGMIAVKAEATVLPCYIKMKKRKWAPFRRVDVYIGKPIRFEEFNYDAEASGEYMRISRFVFDRICEMGDAVDAENK